MWFWIVSVFAATPQELEAAAPEAALVLERCAASGCEAQAGAEAAWLVALHRYQSEGEASGELAATVRALNGELFEALPDVLQQAATEPLSWAVSSEGLAPLPEEVPEALRRGPDPGPYEHNDKLPDAVFRLMVWGDHGPVDNATVRFLDEHVEHRGGWEGSVRSLPSGEERFFQLGDRVPVEVRAPGYHYVRAELQVNKRRKNIDMVRLKPWVPTAGDDPTPEGVRAVEAFKDWVYADVAAQRAPSDESFAAERAAQQRTAMAARAWMDAGGEAQAQELCLLAGTIPYCELPQNYVCGATDDRAVLNRLGEGPRACLLGLEEPTWDDLEVLYIDARRRGDLAWVTHLTALYDMSPTLKTASMLALQAEEAEDWTRALRYAEEGLALPTTGADRDRIRGLHKVKLLAYTALYGPSDSRVQEARAALKAAK